MSQQSGYRCRKGVLLAAGVGAAILVTGLLVLSAFRLVVDPLPVESGFEEMQGLESLWILDTDQGCSLSVTTKQVRRGAHALRIEAPEGLRCELVPRVYTSIAYKFLREPFGEPRLYRFSTYVETYGDGRISEKITDNTVVAQWHASPDPLLDGDGRGPPLALRIHNNRWGLTYDLDARLLSQDRYLANRWHWIAPVETGRWIDWEFRVVWSAGEDGLTEVFRDGNLVYRRAGPNTYNDLRGVYLKLGLYHPVADSVIYLDEVSVIDGQF